MTPRLVITALVSVFMCSACATSASRAPQSTPSTRERFSHPEELVLADSAEFRPLDRRIAPRYPPDARVAGEEAAFIAVAVLDTAGRFEKPSITFLGPASSRFRDSVCDYLNRERFAPVMRADHARRAVFVIPLVFALTGGEWEGKTLSDKPVRGPMEDQGIATYIPQLDSLPHCAS